MITLLMSLAIRPMNKTVVVTGGTRGIGGAVSQVLSAGGWHVVAASNSQEEIDAYGKPSGIDTYLLDVTSDDSVRSLFSGLDKLDALVNCAGILQRDAEYDLSVFQKVIEVNLTGTMRCCVNAQPLLAQSKGAIVNTASMLSTFGGPLVPAYSASKGGVAQLTKALAGKWAENDIRVNAVAPGWIETEMTQGIRDAPERSETILNRTPMKRWGKAEEVAYLVKWLLSDEASFVTGSIYPVDGGYKAL
jgi:NAD(P)-dependent dehydrogenase (short-subunit alcohol dehydrogenase family)